MSKNVKISLALVVVAVAAVLGIGALTNDEPDEPETATERDALLVRDDSPRLSDGPNATFVEFLDFACEACGALYPTIEQLRAEYGDRVTFVVRYMPLHVPSVNAAKAAEAAADQGQFEAMYSKLFETQAEWGESQSGEEERFFGYAEELGLDMERFREVYDDPATLARIQQSEEDGRALGVTGTPTLFMDGERLDPQTIDDLVAAFDAAAGS